MRKRTFCGITMYLTEKEWRELLKRFDSSKAVRVEGKYNWAEIWEIPSKGCYLCTKHRGEGSPACKGCPLDSQDFTCGDVMEDVLGAPFGFHAEIRAGVWWRHVTGKDDVDKMHKALMNMERVERRDR